MKDLAKFAAVLNMRLLQRDGDPVEKILKAFREVVRDTKERAAKVADVEYEDPGDSVDAVLTRVAAKIRALE